VAFISSDTWADERIGMPRQPPGALIRNWLRRFVAVATTRLHVRRIDHSAEGTLPASHHTFTGTLSGSLSGIGRSTGLGSVQVFLIGALVPFLIIYHLLAKILQVLAGRGTRNPPTAILRQLANTMHVVSSILFSLNVPNLSANPEPHQVA